MKKILLFSISLLISAGVFSQIPANVVYISPEGSGLMDGSSWQNALDGNSPAENGYSRLADTLKFATAGIHFWIAEGTYYTCTDNDREKSFELKQNIRLYGGFAGTETDTLQRTIALHPTVFSGDIGVVNDSTDNTKIILKTISVPWTIYSHIDGIDFFRAFNSVNYTIGTGIYNSGLLAVRNCSFKNNYSVNNGAGIHNARDLRAENCLFYNNRAITGAGLYNSGTNGSFPSPCSVIKSSTFSNNNATGSGGGIRNEGLVSVINSLIVNNNSGGIYSKSTTNAYNVTARIYNSTIANNTGYNVYMHAGKVTILNSVSWGGAVGFDLNPVKDIRYSTIQAYSGGPLILNEDPLFVNATAGTGTGFNGLSADWSLRWCSPAINAGADSLIPAGITTDIEGNSRIKYSSVDHGAYETDTTGVFRNLIGFANNRIYISDTNLYTGNGSSWGTVVAGNAESCKYPGQSMLYEAMKDAPAGREVWIRKGTYKCSLSNNRNHAFTIASGVKVYGGFEGNETAVNERGTGETDFSGDIGVEHVSADNGYHVFNINPEALVFADSALLDGVTVEKGYAGTADGAGILVNSNTKVIFNNIAVKANATQGSGSGICVKSQARVTIRNSTIRGNIGHGIYSAGRLSVISCTVGTNASTGLYSTDSLWLNNCSIDSNGVSGIISSSYCSLIGGSVSDNLASVKGGGVWNKTGGKLFVRGSNISGNTSPLGGGLYNEGFLEISESSINNNSAGGGAYNTGTFHIETSRICNNQTSGYGGGIYNPTSVRNCIVANNEKISNVKTGGGLFIGSGCQGIFNTTVANNIGEGISSTIISNGYRVINPDTFQIKNSIVYGNDIQLEGRFNVFNSCIPQVQAGDGNIFANPFWINPTLIRGPAGNGLTANWGLRNYSRCINSGNNAFLSTVDTADVLGNQRVLFGTVDMGAVESLQPLIDSTPVNHTVAWEVFKPRPVDIQLSSDECWGTVYLEQLETQTGNSDLTTQSRIRGLLMPPMTGFYKFYMASDRGGRFWLSIDSTELRVVLRSSNDAGTMTWPATLGSIDSVYLEAFTSYYFETFCKYSSTVYPQNYLKIGWTLPGSNALQVITGDYFRQADQKQSYNLRLELFKNITTYNFNELKNSANIPDEVVQLDSVNIANHSTFLDHYASRIRGYLVPPVTGNYSFYFACADQGQFWLSSDTSETNAQLKSDILTSQTNWAQNISSQDLIEGQKYFFEILHYDTTYTDLIKLGWMIPGTTSPVTIKTPYFMSYHRNVPITSFLLTDDEVTAFPGWQVTPRYHYTPWNAEFRNPQRIRWSNTNNTIAQVNTSGTISMNSPGSCRVIANVSGNSALADSVAVTVTNHYGPWFVKQDASETGTGHSWVDAIRLTKLLDILNLGTATQTRQVFVAEGTYKPTTTIDRNKTFVLNNVRILGGFASDITGTDTITREIQNHETILSGDIGIPGNSIDNSYHVVTTSGQESAWGSGLPTNFTTIDGITIQDGRASGSTYGFTAGTYTFMYNDNGGGMFIRFTKAVINQCVLRNNSCWNAGGGIYGQGSAHTKSILSIQNSLIANNLTQTVAFSGGGWFQIIVNSYGAGLLVTTTDLSVINCTFNGNYAQGGGASGRLHGIATFENCNFIGNTGSNNLYLESGTINLIRSTMDGFSTPISSRGDVIINNSTLKGNIENVRTGSANIKNSTITGSLVPIDISTPKMSYIDNSIIQNFTQSALADPNISAKYSVLGTLVVGADKNIIVASGIPSYSQWLDSLANNGGPTPTMRLKNIPGNPAKIHGNPAYLGTPDQRGYARADTVSIGAYQWVWPSSVTINPDQASMAPGDSLAYTVAVLPEIADDKSWSLTSSDPAVATAGGSFLNAFTMGSAMIHVRTNDGNRRDTCHVTVMNDSAVASGTLPVSGDACYDALEVITVAGGGQIFRVPNGSSATMIAGERILCLPGTKVEPGGYLHGYIAPQGPWCQVYKAIAGNPEDSGWDGMDDSGDGKGNGFRVYPNPTEGCFTVEHSTLNGSTPVIIRCYDLTGAMVLEKQFSSGTRHELTLEGRKPGIYLLRVIQGNHPAITKIIKH